jgi:hypothetical protein
MGIAPIIKLSVVNGTCIPLLLLPRFHGFGANESQPPRGFVLHAPIVMLKTGVAFLPRLVVLAVLIEARDGEPSPISTGLTSLRVETSGKRVLFGKHGTIALQVILADTALIHPEAKTLVADELHYADSFINGGVLPFRAVYLVLVDKHLAFLLSLC